VLCTVLPFGARVIIGRLLVLVPAGDDEVGKEVEKAEHGEQPEEVVEVAAVEVLRDPPDAAVPGGDVGDDGHQDRAEVVAERDGGERQRGAHAPHGVGRLVVEELQLPHEGEHLRAPDDEVLRYLPEDGDGHDVVLAVQAVPRDGAQPHDVQHARRHHGEDGDDEADAHALQLREPARPPGVGAHQGHDGAVVHGDPDDDADGVHHGQRRRGDLEPGPHALVQRVTLQHEHGAHLRVHRREHDPAGPDGQQPDHALELLHLRHRAQAPRARLRAVLGRHHGSPVEARQLLRVLQLAAPLDDGLPVHRLVQPRLVRGHGHVPLARARDEHLRDARQRAAPGLLVPVQRRAHEEAADGDGHDHGGDAEAPAPAHVRLHVHQHCGRHQRADVDGEVEPVEEGALALLLPLVVLVELVGAEGGHARLDPARAQRDEVQRHEHHRRLRVRRVAHILVAARRRHQPLHRRSHRQQRQALFSSVESIRQSQVVSSPRRMAMGWDSSDDLTKM
jgi:hypothetical protein